jgi:hypothetical protein
VSVSEHPQIATGYLTRAPADALLSFALFLVADDAIELRFDASSLKVAIRLDRTSEYGIKEAVQKRLGCEAQIDFRVT